MYGSDEGSEHSLTGLMTEAATTVLRWLRRKLSRAAQDNFAEQVLPHDIRRIANVDLTEDDLPPATAGWGPPGIQAFALSFGGYQYWGSLEKCAEVAGDLWTESLDTLTMTELRTKLFFVQRTLRHCDEDPSPSELLRIRAIVDAICDRVRRREVA